MEIKVTFPGAARVDAQYGALNIVTNQDGSAPPPFALFLASIGTCAGIYVKSFCDQRNIPADDIEIIQRMETDPLTRLVGRINMEIKLPAGFPDKYREAVIRAADQCAVKKHLAQPPVINVTADIAANATVAVN